MVSTQPSATSRISPSTPGQQYLRCIGTFAMLLALLTSSGCATTTTSSTHAASEELSSISTIQLPEVLPEKTPKEAPTAAPGSIPVNLLSNLLTAEFAGQRQRYGIAVEHYLNAARQTDAEEVTSRAARVARFAGNTDSTREAAERWLSSSPGNTEAHQLLVHAALGNNNYEEAIHHTLEIKRITGQSQFEFFTARLIHMSKQEKQTLLEQLNRIQPQHPDDASLLTTLGVVEQSLVHINPALARFDQALAIQPDYQPPAVMKARLLVAIKRNKQALAWLEQATALHPAHQGMQELRAQTLLRLDRLEEAFSAYSTLYERNPNNPEIGFTLALLSIDRDMPQRARGLLTPLTSNAEYADRANYYLGLVEQDDGQPEQALTHFSKVNESTEYIPASAEAAQLIASQHSVEKANHFLSQRIQEFPKHAADLMGLQAELLIEHQQKEEALQIYNQGLQTSPDNTGLLYGRAMLYAQNDNLAGLESDLKRVIELEPNNANALNALGYTLADKTSRTEEALTFIRRAFVLAPRSAAISDSLGWAYFRLGNLKQAEKYLKRAYTRMPDPEIAAHYGELLWATQRQKKAVQIWKNSLKDNPENHVIKETLERLKVTIQ